MRNNKIIYSINIGDIQKVAEDFIERKLTDNELEKVSDKVENHINWYDAIEYAMNDVLKEEMDNHAQPYS